MKKRKILLGFITAFIVISVLSFGFGCNSNSSEVNNNTEYVGELDGHKYHYPWCRVAKEIHPSRLITFSSVAEAKDQGYTACITCKPPISD